MLFSAALASRVVHRSKPSVRQPTLPHREGSAPSGKLPCASPANTTGACAKSWNDLGLPRPARSPGISVTTASRRSATRSHAPSPGLRSSRSEEIGNTRLAPCWADRKGSAYRTCGTAALPWHRTCARPESDSAGRRRRSPGSQPHHWLRSTDPAAALVSAGFPSPCHIDAQNISEVTCFDQRSHCYHGLLEPAHFRGDLVRQI